MATATASVTLSTTAYTALSTAGQANVMVQSQRHPLQIAIATSLPTLATANWFPLAAGDQMMLRGLGASDIVYALPSGASGDDSATRIVKVITQ